MQHVRRFVRHVIKSLFMLLIHFRQPDENLNSRDPNLAIKYKAGINAF